jgi:hypothetical protein
VRRQLPNVNAILDPLEAHDGVSDWNVVTRRVVPPSAAT